MTGQTQKFLKHIMGMNGHIVACRGRYAVKYNSVQLPSTVSMVCAKGFKLNKVVEVETTPKKIVKAPLIVVGKRRFKVTVKRKRF